MLNNVNCIMGQVRSGKTSKLIDAFINENIDSELYNTVFITCEETADEITKRCIAASNAKGFDKSKDIKYKIVECHSRGDILKAIAVEVNKKDTLFFIDMPETCIRQFTLIASNMVSQLPNKDCNNEMSITWTKSKPISSYKINIGDKGVVVSVVKDSDLPTEKDEKELQIIPSAASIEKRMKNESR